MPLRVALSPDHSSIELTLPGGGKTTLRVEGHTGESIRNQLLQNVLYGNQCPNAYCFCSSLPYSRLYPETRIAPVQGI